MLKLQKDSADRKEVDYNNQISRQKDDLARERDKYRQLMSDNADLTKKYEDMLKHKENQSREVQENRERLLALESKIRAVHDN